MIVRFGVVADVDTNTFKGGFRPLAAIGNGSKDDITGINFDQVARLHFNFMLPLVSLGSRID